MASNKTRALILAVVICLATMYLLFGIDLPGHTMLWREIGNAGHIPLFGVIAIALLIFSRAFLSGWLKRPILHYAFAFILASGLGFATEFLQWFTPRDADFWDIVRDVIGAAGFLGLAAAYDKSLSGSLGKKGLARGMIIAASVSILIAGLSPVIAWMTADIYRSLRLPVICDFESPAERFFIRLHHAELARVEAPDTWRKESSNRVGLVDFLPAEYPELYMLEPYPDWSRYHRFSFEVFNPSDSAVNLTLRIEDAWHTGDYTDRFNRTFILQPGGNTIAVDCSDIETAPATRKMEMSSISAFSLFLHDIKTPVILYFDEIRLE